MTLKLSIDRVLNTEHFYGKHAKHVYPKLVLDHFLVLVNKPNQQLHARYSFENRIF